MKTVFFVLFMMPAVLFSQLGYKEGFIVTVNNDTISGLIENRSYYENSIRCNFKMNEGDKVSEYGAGDILGYRFNEGKYYVSKRYEDTDYFFEYLIQGKLNIYFKQNRDNSNHYYIEKDSLPFRELTYRSEVITDENGIKKIYESKNHNLLLAFYTNDYPELKGSAMAIKEPDNKALIDFARDYHNAVCKDVSCTVFEKRSPVVFEFEFNAGPGYIFENPANFIPPKLYLSGGIMGSVMAPQISESIFFGLGLNFNNHYPVREVIEKIPSSLDFNGDTIYYYVYKTAFRKKLQLPFTVYYNSHCKGFSPVAGLSANILYLFEFKVFAGISYCRNNISVKLTGEYDYYPVPGAYVNSAGVKIGVSYLLK
jgi:hypothetical protein